MLLPQFTIRSLLAITAVAALVAWVLQQAVAGALWAQCAGWAIVFAALLFFAYAGLFLLAWIGGQLLGVIRPTYTPVASPFAATPQVAFNVPTEVNPFGQPVNPFAQAGHATNDQPTSSLPQTEVPPQI